MPEGATECLGGLVDIGISELTQGPRRHFKARFTSLLQPSRSTTLHEGWSLRDKRESPIFVSVVRRVGCLSHLDPNKGTFLSDLPTRERRNGETVRVRDEYRGF